tara:strand:- start:112337 stop:115519 length:3183 start_codon:yes stop_codon:yes gene_type:complete
MPYNYSPSEIYNLINNKRNRPWKGEEEVRLAWIFALEQGLDVHFDAERSKKDSNYNNVIIEFKAPGFFNGKKDSPKFIEATEDRLLKYILKSSKHENVLPEDFIGIAIDGEHICFCQVLNGTINSGHLIPFSEQSVGMVMEACAQNFRRSISTENLIKDFGHTSSVAVSMMQSLSQALEYYLSDNKTSKIKMLFEEWKTLYGQVADLSIEQLKNLDKTISFEWNGDSSLSIPARLFVIHTYNSLLIKLMAAEIISAHGLTSKKNPAEEMSTLLSDDALIERLQIDVERGVLFSEAGISGFVEEVIFSWYLDACDSVSTKNLITNALRDILSKLSLYRTDRLDHTRDVLRDFYQDLVPEVLRKSLGEFYTPDWLVEFTIDKFNISDWRNIRALDPTCGSGSFLIELIRRKKKQYEKQNLSPREIVENICDTVWGFDLNPLAVQTARVNFLMEIASLLKVAPGMNIEIPILLADAIYSPAKDPDQSIPIVKYSIGSQVAKLDIVLPTELAFNREQLDQVFESMGESVEENLEFDIAKEIMLESGIISKEHIFNWSSPLKKTYDQVLNLHRNNWNGIWFRIVRNFFWSATAGKFDIVVGNPPWVRWSKLPVSYRERVKPTCEQYDIFSKTPHHGGNELDISAMITFTVSDKWLNDNGKLSFVITQTVFQNPSSAGFRNFKIDDEFYLSPIMIDDMKSLKPFPDASNKTSIALFEKSKVLPKYPVKYVVWKNKPEAKRTINPQLSLVEVLSKIEKETNEAHPVGGLGSPWAILRPGRKKVLNKLMGTSSWYEGRKGVTADLNGLYFVNLIQDNGNSSAPLVQINTRPEAGRTDIGPKKTVWVEPNFLYPIVKGASDFKACYFRPKLDLFGFIPNKGIRKADYQAVESELRDLPKTRSYFKYFKKNLEKRSTWKGRMPNAPFYSVYNVGDFTFKPWKVIWAEMSSNFSCAVTGLGDVPLLGARPYVPDHKIYFVAFDNKSEAYFLCGLLNSAIVKEYVESHNISIQVGDIFKHMKLPKFDSSSGRHMHLSKLVEKAHSIDNLEQRTLIVDDVINEANSILMSYAG